MNNNEINYSNLLVRRNVFIKSNKVCADKEIPAKLDEDKKF